MSVFFNTKAGATVTQYHASIEDAEALKNRVAELLVDLDIKEGTIDVLREILSPDKKGSLLDVNLNAECVNNLKKILLTFEIDKKLDELIFKCLSRWTYNDFKISKKTFEEVEARQDLLQIKTECLKYELLPFFKNLFSFVS